VLALFGADPRTRAIPADARDEVEQLFANLAAILAAAGVDLTAVVRVGIVMHSLQRDRPVFNEVWAEQFGGHRPARSAIEASDFGRRGENARWLGAFRWLWRVTGVRWRAGVRGRPAVRRRWRRRRVAAGPRRRG
jgi:2-iminobutanoate/2-iminopropanoate deaminase